MKSGERKTVANGQIAQEFHWIYRYTVGVVNENLLGSRTKRVRKMLRMEQPSANRPSSAFNTTYQYTRILVTMLLSQRTNGAIVV